VCAAGLPGTAPARAPAGCAPNLAGRLVSTGSASQVITVVAAQAGVTRASVRLWERKGGCWEPVAGPWVGRLGRGGLSSHHREGDGTTPSGVYGIGPVMYGTAPDPGLRYRFHRLACGDWWDEDPGSPSYNTFRHVACGAKPPFAGDSEGLWTYPVAYSLLAVIDYNNDPVVPGRGSAIFIHADTGAPTAGCVSLPQGHLVQLLRRLRPADRPLVVIGTQGQIASF
jgi:L,D-peptidoglycan transpeptidase YkuD (ErfK/YbiS/YcfS/YnhG family)